MKWLRFNTDDVVVYLAAAGSGKTTVLMDEMTKLLAKYRPDEIAFVTFTRKGVENGVERALQVNSQLLADDLVYFKTLHSLCYRALGLKRSSILTDTHMKKFNSILGFNVYLAAAFEQQTEDDKLLSIYDARRSGSTKGLYANRRDFSEERYVRLTKAYEAFKEANGLVDFHDCLLRFRDANKSIGVKVAFIDEAQDLTPLQWEVCRIAFADCEKIRIAGDDYQSVFSYAGADPEILVELSQHYKTVKLEVSYRLPKSVYRFSKAITYLIQEKVDKDYRPVKDTEGFVAEIRSQDLLIREVERDIKENGFMPYRWYLLFRNNCFIETMTGKLEYRVIPYHTPGGFCVPKRDLMKIRRFYNYRKKGFGTKESLKAFCEKYHIEDINEEFVESGLVPTERRYVYSDYLRKYGIDALEEMARKEPAIFLATTHRVKGGEADYVAVFLDCTRQVDMNRQFGTDEELRVLYVACTRARIGLYLVASSGKYSLERLVDIAKEQIVPEEGTA